VAERDKVGVEALPPSNGCIVVVGMRVKQQEDATSHFRDKAFQEINAFGCGNGEMAGSKAQRSTTIDGTEQTIRTISQSPLVKEEYSSLLFPREKPDPWILCQIPDRAQ
jgi:hypothetical protein